MSSKDPRSESGSPVGVDVDIILADAAETANGKISMLGGGWSMTGPAPSPSALAVFIHVPWSMANAEFNVVIDLLDADGQPALLPAPDGSGEQPLRLDATTEVGRPPGLPLGWTLDIPMAINLGPLPLTPGKTYVWQVSVDGVSMPSWRKAFYVRKQSAPSFQLAG